MKTTVSCVALENYQVQARTDRHSWIVDEPTRLGGDGIGPNPFDLLLASLGACTTITIYHYAAQAKLPVEKIAVDVAGEWTGDGHDAYAIHVTVRVRGPLDDKALKRIAKAAERCPVHGLLAPGTHIDTQVVPV